MGDCLVTKLKGVVDNPNLPTLGVITLDLVSETNAYLAMSNADTEKPIEVELLQGSIVSANPDAVMLDSTHFKINSGASLYTGVMTQENNMLVKARISNYYGLSKLMYLASSNDIDKILYTHITSLQIKPKLNFDVSKLVNLTNTRDLNIVASNNYLVGDFSGLKNLVQLTSFRLTDVSTDSEFKFNSAWLSNLVNLTDCKVERCSAPGFTMRLSDFGRLVNLTILRLQDTNTAGTVEEFVAAQIAAGRTTCSGIAIGINMGRYVTFQGNPITGDIVKTLSWTSASDITIV